jgi:hypothetical protein
MDPISGNGALVMAVRGQFCQQLGLARMLQGLDHIAQIAFHHGQQLVQREVDAVVGQAALGKL